MIIGVDFDNTIVNYNSLFYKIALEKDLIPSDLKPTKGHVRDFLRNAGKENIWTEMQGYAYGSRILEAEPFHGIKEFFRYCLQQRIKAYIISHKTRNPYLGPKIDLHKYAYLWLEKQGFFNDIGLTKDDVFFELTKDDKIKRIIEMQCTHFIDDLPEFLSEKRFPSNVIPILFNPNNQAGDSFKHATSWTQVKNMLK